MAIKVTYSSSIDRYISVLRVLTSLIYFILVLLGISTFLEASKISVYLKFNGTVNLILFFILLIGSIMISNYLYQITAGKIYRILSSYLYVRIELKAKITWKDAEFVSFLFTPNETGKWYNMHNVLKLPKDQRVSYIVGFAEKVLLDFKNK